MTTEVVFCIKGMSCAACSAGIERSLKRKNGIITVTVNLLQESARIEFDDTKICLEEIFSLIEKLGYEPSGGKKKEIGILQKLESRFLTPKIRVISSIVLSFLVVYISMLAPFLQPFFLENPIFSATLELLITLIVMHLGRDFYFRGLKALLHRNPNMDSLVALGSGASFLYSLFIYIGLLFGHHGHLYFESVCVILAFIMLGKFLEDYAKKRASKSLDSLLDFYESNAWKFNDGDYQEVPIKSLIVGDRVKVLPGGVIPLDGILLDLHARLDESMLSGESLPVAKKKGDEVLGGSVNLGQVFVMEVLREHTKSTMAQVLNLVRQAQNAKAPIARIADIVAAYFVPFVICIALFAGIFWWFWKSDFAFGLEVFISVLVVSCPCALGLATPMAVLIGSIKASQHALLFKDAKVLGNAHKIDYVVFDKTGTLTQGELEITCVEIVKKNMSEEEILCIAASLESGSFHPIAKAILKEAQKRDIALKEGSDFCDVIGDGISARIDGELYKIGKYSTSKIHESAVCLSRIKDESLEILGVIYLKDMLKEDAAFCIKFLKKHAKKTLILSGDQEHLVSEVAQKLQVDKFFANLKPNEKLEILKKLKTNHQKVMMVGDGLNDPPALALADVAVAMGMGSDLSKDRADIVILNNDILGVINAIKLSKSVLRNIKQNLFWAFFYNIIALAFACGVAYYQLGLMLDPMIAAFAMSFSSLFVVLNAQRLHFFKFIKNKGEDHGSGI